MRLQKLKEPVDGWHYDYGQLKDFTYKVNEQELGEGLSMEDVEAVLLALDESESSSPSHNGTKFREQYLPKLKQIGSESRIALPNAAQVTMGFMWKEKFPLDAIEIKSAYGVEIVQTKLLPYLMKLVEFVGKGNQQQLKSSIGEETEGQDETWLQLFNDLDKWSRSMKSSEDTLPKIQELKSKYTLIKK